MTEETLIQWLADRITAREGNNERGNMSPSDASLSTWRGYLNEPVSYYIAGGVLGALLDVSILRDTGGRRGLDDVMRSLWQDFYLAGRGFTAPELVEGVSEVAGRDYTEFFDRYVSGTDIPPYDTIFAAVGVRAEPRTIPLGVLGAGLGPPSQGGRLITNIAVGSAAQRAGLLSGDVLMAVEGQPLPTGQFPFGQWLGTWAGRQVILSVIRDGRPMEITAELATGQRTVFALDVLPTPTASQQTVRQAWLERK